jgi:hypothetical protein
MNELTRQSNGGRFVVSADWPLIALPGIIWGASFLFIAEGLKAMGPSGVTFFCLFVGAATLVFFPVARKPVARSAWPAIALVGVLWFAFPLSMFPFAEQRVASALTGMLTTPCGRLRPDICGLLPGELICRYFPADQNTWLNLSEIS